VANHLLTVADGQRGIALNNGSLIVDAGDQIVVTDAEFTALAALRTLGVLIDGGTTAAEPTYGGVPSGGGSGITSLTYDNALTGSRFTILYTGSWPASRPSARTDIYFDCVGGTAAVASPAWMLNGDAREIVP
jgi:hypothetical protein